MSRVFTARWTEGIERGIDRWTEEFGAGFQVRSKSKPETTKVEKKDKRRKKN